MATIPIIGDIIKEVGSTVRELIPDADKRLELDIRLAELASQAEQRETELLLQQMEVNKEEARNSNLFVAGWRPAIGWVCAGSLGWTWVFAPLLQWGAGLFGIDTSLPALDPNAMYPIVTAMLGISLSRTVEKIGGVATSVNGRVLANERKQETPVDKVVQKVTKPVSRWFK